MWINKALGTCILPDRRFECLSDSIGKKLPFIVISIFSDSNGES